MGEQYKYNKFYHKIQSVTIATSGYLSAVVDVVRYCKTYLGFYECSLFGNKTNTVDLSLSVAIELSVFATLQ